MKVLIVDDEKHIRESIQRLLAFEQIGADCSGDGREAKQLLLDNTYDVIILDLKLPGLSGQELLEWIREEDIRAPVIMISAHGEINDAVTALKTGAKDYLVKPFDPAELILKIKEAAAAKKMEDLVELGKRTAESPSRLLGSSSSIISLREMIRKIAATGSTVLITGESGTGKEVAAREIHDFSPGCEEPFVAVNIGGLPETLIESELFGHEKGAFTGAEARKPGLFELAGKGTLFLDEIGEMPTQLQVKLLRVLQERKIRRLGGTRDIPVEARILSATNKDIESLVKKGSFREDLFYRLNVVRMQIPPLRERREDIPLLTGHILQKLAIRMGMQKISLDRNAARKLQEYDFPGNIRELENILERAMICCTYNTISETDIQLGPMQPGKCPADTDKQRGGKPAAAVGSRQLDAQAGSIRDAEREAIIRALQKWNGNRTKAAEELGISRRTVIYKIQRYHIDD